MKKFNLFNEIIVADKKNLQQAIDKGISFGITIGGRVVYPPFTKEDILIYEGIPDGSVPLQNAFAKEYQIVEDGNRILIKAFGAWQNIISLNTPRATYDDTTADGVDQFSTKEMEDIGWHAAEFNIKYRTLVELLEKSCEGTLLCIEQEEPYQFSGLGFVDAPQKAAEIMFEYCQKEIKRLMKEEDDFAKENLNDDELEAAAFFRVIG